MSEHSTRGTNAPRTGRRAAPVPAGFDPNDPYVREVLDLAAKSPGNRGADNTVDFDRLAQEEPDAPPNFDLLVEHEAVPPGALVGFAVYGEPDGDPAGPKPAADVPGPVKAAGEVDDFPVYGEPQPGALSDIPVYGEPVISGAAAEQKGYSSRDVGATDKPNFYDDPSAAEPEHKVRFRPGSSYSVGRRNAFRADARGVPVFAPGWTAAAVAKSYARARLVRFILAGTSIAGAAGMVILGVGSNADYLEMKAIGTPVTGTVVSVLSESAQDTAAEAAVDRLGVTTTELATVEFTVDGTKHRHELSASSEGGAALMGASAVWPAGSDVELLVDPADPTRAVLLDEDQPDQVNLFTLIPLVPAALFAAGGVAAHANTRKMRAITTAS